MATRCCWPPESWAGQASALCARPTLSSSSSARARLCFRPAQHGEEAFHHIAQCGAVREKLEVLEHHAGLPPHPEDRVARDMLAGETYRILADDELAGLRDLKQVHAAQQRALARSGGADQRGDGTLADGQAHPGQYGERAEAFHYVGEPDHVAGSR
jgi:hypothetical protein